MQKTVPFMTEKTGQSNLTPIIRRSHQKLRSDGVDYPSNPLRSDGHRTHPSHNGQLSGKTMSRYREMYKSNATSIQVHHFSISNFKSEPPSSPTPLFLKK
jgi:hypothetical protein